MKDDLYDEVAKLAYELYEKNGRIEGRNLNNWLEAERIVRARYAARENQGIGELVRREYFGDERRKHKRVFVKGIRGNVSHLLNTRIINISVGGAAVETTRKLGIHKEYSLKINHGGYALLVKGHIVWSLLTNIEKKKSGDIVAVYKAGMKFQQPLFKVNIP
jgi:hypothetical protein